MAKAVIFIPGIKGTKLVETNKTPYDTIWSEIQYRFESIEDTELTPGKKGNYYDIKMASIIHHGEIEELGYGSFIRNLRNLDVKSEVYIFGYDWRFPAELCAKSLSEFMDYLTRKSEAANSATIDKFDFVTHSMGNHILRAYLQKHGMGKVGRIVFVAPPFKGSLDIASGVLLGEGWFEKVEAKFRKLIRSFPGALQLLPVYDDAGLLEDGNKSADFFNAKHWQSTVKDNDIFKKTLSKAKETLKNSILDLAALSQEERDRVLVVARTRYKTAQSIRIKSVGPNEHTNYFDFRHMCNSKNGDGRVPDISSCCYYKEVKTMMINNAFSYIEHSHATLMRDARVQGLCSRWLKTGNLDYKGPDESVRRVKGLDRMENAKGLPYWKAVT